MDAVHIVHSCWWLVDNVIIIERGFIRTKKNGLKIKKKVISIMLVFYVVKVKWKCFWGAVFATLCAFFCSVQQKLLIKSAIKILRV